MSTRFILGQQATFWGHPVDGIMGPKYRYIYGFLNVVSLWTSGAQPGLDIVESIQYCLNFGVLGLFSNLVIFLMLKPFLGFSICT